MQIDVHLSRAVSTRRQKICRGLHLGMIPKVRHEFGRGRNLSRKALRILAHRQIKAFRPSFRLIILRSALPTLVDDLKGDWALADFHAVRGSSPSDGASM